MTEKKKQKPPYNEKSAIRGALRAIFRQHPVLQIVLKRERIERPFVKKDGSISSKPRVFFKCYACQETFPRKEIQLDHIDPVGPTPGSKLAPPELDWNTFIARMFCHPDNIGTICLKCHKSKTDAETSERFRLLKEMRDAG